ncbi:MAG: DUF6799 domain-containing protein [Flavitalea sp.]
MKKILAMALVAFSFVACNDADDDNDSIDSVDTTVTATPPPTTSYTPVDGDVTYTEKKVMVMRNGAWVEAEKEVELDNDVIVYRDGRVKKADREIVLEDGEIVSRTGNFFDRTGNAIENAWDDTKRGVKKAGKAVGDAAEKVGDKIDGDNN